MNARRSRHDNGLTAPALGGERLTLRVLGTSVSLIEPIRRRAEEDLGIEVEFIVEDGTSAQRIAALYPEAFDVYDQWFHNIDLIWPARAVRPIELRRIEKWGSINDLPKTGRMAANAAYAPGGNPAARLFVQHDGEIGPVPSERISMLPTVHNADSFAVAANVIDDDPAVQTWASLLDERFKGRAALQSDAAIGVIDAILALQASGEIRFEDPGNLTVHEIDVFIEKLLALRKRGHFKAWWTTESEAGALFQARRISVASMWWQGFVALRRRGIDIRMAVPREGYRGWYGGLALSSRMDHRKQDAAYDYLNWWLSGYAGAMMTRHNAYISNPEVSRDYLSSAEWAYWYEGSPAAEDLRCPLGRTIVRRGETYPGGSYKDRMSRVAIWNSVMDEHNYLVRRWREVQIR